MKYRLLASAGTLQDIETIINKYFYSTSYHVNGEQIESSKTGKVLTAYRIILKKGRYRFEMEV